MDRRRSGALTRESDAPTGKADAATSGANAAGGVSLTQMADSLWVADGPRIRMLGIPFPTRMTIVRLADGGLWLHSPIPADAAMVIAVEALGPIRHLVAPNKFHNLFVSEWAQRFPYATTWAGPYLRERVEIHFDHDLADRAEACWAADLDQLLFLGSGIMAEAVFFHRPSRSLIITDIIQNHEPSEDGVFWRTLKRLNNVGAPNGGVPRDWQLTVRDRESARRARDRILAWDFDRLILAHGRCLDSDALEHVERAFSWLG